MGDAGSYAGQLRVSGRRQADCLVVELAVNVHVGGFTEDGIDATNGH